MDIEEVNLIDRASWNENGIIRPFKKGKSAKEVVSNFKKIDRQTKNTFFFWGLNDRFSFFNIIEKYWSYFFEILLRNAYGSRIVQVFFNVSFEWLDALHSPISMVLWNHRWVFSKMNTSGTWLILSSDQNGYTHWNQEVQASEWRLSAFPSASQNHFLEAQILSFRAKTIKPHLLILSIEQSGLVFELQKSHLWLLFDPVPVDIETSDIFCRWVFYSFHGLLEELR